MPEAPLQMSAIDQRAIVRIKPWSGATISMASLVPPGLDGQVRLLSYAPAEWLAVSDSLEGGGLHSGLASHTRGGDVGIVDLSCALKALRLQGHTARDVLSKGCGLDLHPNSFLAGQCTRTRFAQLAVIIDHVDPTPRFDLYVGRSYVAWLRSWLTNAAAEFA